VAVARPGRRRRLRRIAAVLLVLIALVAVVAIVALAPGSYETYPRTSLLTAAGQRAAPAWTRPCWVPARFLPDPLCAHVSGRVVWIQHHDPDGDGDRHLIVVEGLHPRIVKVPLSLGVSYLPGYGTRIDAVGYLYRGGSGRLEIIARRLVPGGPTGG
jgi:hypothetical protein